MPAVFAHETWFTSGPFPTDWSFAGETLTLVGLLAAALAVTLVVRLGGRSAPPGRRRAVPWRAWRRGCPSPSGCTSALSLVGLLSMGVYLSPAMDLEATVGGIALGVTMGAVAVLMLTGLARPRGRGAARRGRARSGCSSSASGRWPQRPRPCSASPCSCSSRAPAAGPLTRRRGRGARAPRRSTSPGRSGRCGSARGRRADRGRLRGEARESGDGARPSSPSTRTSNVAGSSWGCRSATWSSSGWPAPSRSSSACCSSRARSHRRSC